MTKKKAKKKVAKSSGSFLLRSSRRIKRYVCPNCNSDKPTVRGKCPICGYRG